MTIRTVCFVLAIVTSGWVRWMFFAAAVFLPYVAVVLANAGRESAQELPLPPPVPYREIGPGPSTNAPAA
jgi:sugar phosphate permease